MWSDFSATRLSQATNSFGIRKGWAAPIKRMDNRFER